VLNSIHLILKKPYDKLIGDFGSDDAEKQVKKHRVIDEDI